MSNPIGWTDQTWNPITGCTKVSEGCWNCYAERMSNRLAGRYGYPADDPFRVTLHPDKLDEPLRWRKPRHVFVCSMGDLFHEDVRDEWLYEVLWNTWRTPEMQRHTWQILTKRPERMKYVAMELWGRVGSHPRNVWLGVTAENQARADERIPVLLDTPAAVRFVSVEPMLGPVRLDQFLDVAVLTSPHPMNAYGLPGTRPGLGWVVCGPETGPSARPFDIQWARELRDQCVAAGVPFWYKGGLLDGVEWHERPVTP